MGATNTNITVEDIAPLGGTNADGYRLGAIVAGAKAAANDTLTITNAKALRGTVLIALDADGVNETATYSGTVITLTKAVTTGTVSGFVMYLPK